MFMIQEAISKNICLPDHDEQNDPTMPRILQASPKREGDSQLGLILFIGVSNEYGYTFGDIVSIIPLEREEYNYKLGKYKRKAKHGEDRFINKIKLVRAYLKFRYGA